MYLGSHNLYVLRAEDTRGTLADASLGLPSTPAAWGRLEISARGPQLKVTNYELGVVLPSELNQLWYYGRAC